jgi:heparan-alpha-glucosaminide N-acetyltransferase
MSSSASSGVTLSSAALPTAPAAIPQRIVSIDALRGFVMFTMIFVNDLAGASKEIVPDWMVHFSDRHKGGSGMTFVDLVFPAFLFIVGMSIPIALSGRLAKGEPIWKLLLHVVGRTVSLLAIGILMVNGEGGHANSKLMGFSGTTWTVLMFCSALLAFCSISPPVWVKAAPKTKQVYRGITLLLRAIGIGGLVWAAFVFRGGKDGKQIISLDPVFIHPSWYGILGLIGWSYLVAAVAFLVCRTSRTALLGCVILLLCLFAADRKGQFEDFWLTHVVGIGEALGSLASISVAGVLLGTILLTPATSTVKARTQFTLLFIAGFSAAAMLLTRQWGISKNNATPSWCLWASAITAALWLLFYLVADVLRWRFISKPLAVAGENVLLAYLLSEMMEAVFSVLGWGNWYDGLNGPYLANAIGRSVGCAVFILLITAALNRLGFRLKL